MNRKRREEKINTLGAHTSRFSAESNAMAKICNILKTTDIPDDELIHNLGLFIPRQCLARFIFMMEMYQNILTVPGVIIEFGVRFGQNMILFHNFREIFEPTNFNRRVIGFDTFSGFPATSHNDNKNLSVGDYSVPDAWEECLQQLMEHHNEFTLISHKKKFEIIKGDVTQTIHSFFDQNPEIVVAMAYFDLDIYEPTKVCLERVLPHMVKGSIIGFDELVRPEFPGEARAVQDVLGLNSIRPRKSVYSPNESYFIFE